MNELCINCVHWKKCEAEGTSPDDYCGMYKKAKKEKYPKACFAEELEEDAPEKACISCKFRHYFETEGHNRCFIDGHVIGYLALWCQTCKFHELEKKGD